MKKKGFTLVELLVVIAIIALLMGILMPALARVRMIAYRMVCGSNLSGIGKALLLYAGDSQEAYPMPGYRSAPVIYSMFGYVGSSKGYFDGYNGGTTVLKLSDIFSGLGATDGGQATMGSLLYMLVKYQDVSPKQFICKGDSGSEIFKITSYSTSTVTDLTKIYDFGWKPGKHVSYSYHFPFARNSSGTAPGFPISVSSPPGSPLAADRNPGLDKNALTYIKGGKATGIIVVPSTPDNSPCKQWNANNCQYVDKDFDYNAYAHQREGQNVLYNDGHVKFESTANVGINNDNIYQRWSDTSGWSATAPSTTNLKIDLEACGNLPAMKSDFTAPSTYTDLVPGDTTDSLMVNDVLENGVSL